MRPLTSVMFAALLSGFCLLHAPYAPAKTVEAKQGGYSIDLPSGWKSQVGANGTAIKVVRAGFGDVTIVFRSKPASTEVDSSLLVRRFKAAYSRTARVEKNTAIVERPTKTQVGTFPATTYAYAWNNFISEKLQERTYWFNAPSPSNGLLLFKITIKGPSKTIAQQRKSIDHIIGSFSVRPDDSRYFTEHGGSGPPPDTGPSGSTQGSSRGSSSSPRPTQRASMGGGFTMGSGGGGRRGGGNRGGGGSSGSRSGGSGGARSQGSDSKPGECAPPIEDAPPDIPPDNLRPKVNDQPRRKDKFDWSKYADSRTTTQVNVFERAERVTNSAEAEKMESTFRNRNQPRSIEEQHRAIQYMGGFNGTQLNEH